MTSLRRLLTNHCGKAPNSFFYGCENQVKQVYPEQMDRQPGISLRDAWELNIRTSYMYPRSRRLPLIPADVLDMKNVVADSKFNLKRFFTFTRIVLNNPF